MDYENDSAENRGAFDNKLEGAKADVPSGAQMKSIHSVIGSSKIQSGVWQLKSEEAGTMRATNEEYPNLDLQLTFNENSVHFGMNLIWPL